MKPIRSYARWLPWVGGLFAILFLGSVWSSARAHEYIHPVSKKKIDANWIMRNPKTSFCCGPKDCEPVPGRVKFTPKGWKVQGWHGTIPLTKTFPSIDGQPWACWGRRWTEQGFVKVVRCIFLPRGGQ